MTIFTSTDYSNAASLCNNVINNSYDNSLVEQAKKNLTYYE